MTNEKTSDEIKATQDAELEQELAGTTGGLFLGGEDDDLGDCDAEQGLGDDNAADESEVSK